MIRAAAIVLAAGLGTRMKSKTPKGLHRLAGRPLVSYPISAAIEAGFERVVLVVGHGAAEIREAVEACFPQDRLSFAHQAEPKGTAHATLCAREAVSGFDTVAVINGDLPLLRPASLSALVQALQASDGGFALLSAILPDAFGFGRILRGEHGLPVAVVEERDATPDQRLIREANVGVYAAAADVLFPFLEGIGTDNAKGEYYFTDIVARLAGAGRTVGVHVLDDFEEASQVNDRIELSVAERIQYRRIARRWMAEGVTIHQPETVLIDADSTLGPDSEVWPGTELHASSVGSRCTLGRGCVLTRTSVGDGTEIKPYCVLTDAVVEADCKIGPFSHLRPASIARRGSHVGNFVEMKKTTLGPGSKANHLTYLGDCTIGEKVNVGAGTITCNYDGKHKLPTVIEDGAFIGSDTQLVAPVRVGRNAYVGAGTTVTRDVPDGALALTRPPQVHVEGYSERRKT